MFVCQTRLSNKIEDLLNYLKCNFWESEDVSSTENSCWTNHPFRVPKKTTSKNFRGKEQYKAPKMMGFLLTSWIFLCL